MPDIKLPDGRLIQGVPEGITKEQLTTKLLSSGVLKGNEDWLKPAQFSQPQMGRGEAAFITATNPLNFGDEIKAGIAALTAKTFGGAATKDIDIGDLYREARTTERAKLEKARQNYPSMTSMIETPSNLARGAVKGLEEVGSGMYQTAADFGADFSGPKAILSKIRPDLKNEIESLTPQDISSILGKKATQDSKATSQEGLAYKTGRFVGKVAPFVGVGGASKAGLAVGGGLGGGTELMEDSSVGKRLGSAAIGAVAAPVFGKVIEEAIPAVQSLGIAVAQVPKKLLQKITGIDPKAVKTFQELGIDPTLADVSRSAGLQNFIKDIPVAGKPITEALQKQVNDISGQIQSVVKASPKSPKQMGSQIQQGAKEFKTLANARVSALYDDLDKFIPKKTKELPNEIELYSGGPEPFAGIRNTGAFDKFDGIFASSDYDTAASFGENVKKIRISKDKIFDNHGQLSDKEHRTVFSLIKKEFPEATEDQLDDVYDAVILDSPNLGKLSKLVGEDDYGELSWKMQNLRGRIAGDLGYDAATMQDETGISYLIPHKTKAIINGLQRDEKGVWNKLGDDKIPTNNLSRTIRENKIQDVAAVGNGDTAKVIKRYFNIVDDAGNISYSRLKTFRSVVGAKLDSPMLLGDERAALKRIYGSLSEDMKQAVVKNGGDKALQAFNKADAAFGRKINFLEKNIDPIIKAKTPEKVYKLAISGIKDGGTQTKRLMNILKPEQREYVRASIVRDMGLARKGAQSAEGDVFDPQKFMAEYSILKKNGTEKAIFTPEQVTAYNRLNKVVELTKNTEQAGKKNMLLPTASLLSVGIPTTGVGLIPLMGGGRFISSQMMANPKFINWLAVTAQATPKELPKQFNRLSAITAANPEVREDVLNFVANFGAGDASAEDFSSNNPTEEQIREQLNNQKDTNPVLMNGINIDKESKKIKNRYYRD